MMVMMVVVVVGAIVVAVSATVKLKVKSFPSENFFFALVGLVFVIFNNS